MFAIVKTRGRRYDTGMTGETIQRRLRAALVKYAGPRAELARRTGISQPTLSMVAKGTRRLGLDVAAVLADALGYRLTLTPKRRRDGKEG